MAYQDERCKRLHEVKVRLDDYELQRLNAFIDRFGGEKGVIGRDSIIAFLDLSDIKYDDSERNKLLEERKHVQKIKDDIRRLHSTICSNDGSALDSQLSMEV